MRSSRRNQRARLSLDAEISRCAPSQFHRCYWRLIRAVRASSQLLDPVRLQSRRGPIDHRRVITACVRMARRQAEWQRTPETWIVPAGNPNVQFRSLIGHLFEAYPVPRFMVRAWLREQDDSSEIDLYLHLAAGRSVRQFRWQHALKITRQTAAFFMQAPDDLKPFQALRWAQVRSLGGDARLSSLLCRRSCLAEPAHDEDFWETVIRFLVEQDCLCTDEVLAIVRFIDEQRFQPAELTWGPGAGQQPLQPTFTVRGRSLMSLRRRMTNWQTDVLRSRPPLVASETRWKESDIRPFRCEALEGLWTIEELLTDRELRVEGSIMRHCVATYIPQCARREISIWSLKLHRGDRRQRVATIGVFPQSRKIWQAKGVRNARPSARALEMLEQWAAQEQLTQRENL